MASSSASPGIVPAQLGFLAIYNPSLSTGDEGIEDQIVYYSSIDSNGEQQRRRRRTKPATSATTTSADERNERLRQIGLAQGMVEFSKSFSGETPVDTVETAKSRVVLHELEPGWWILASVDLTRIPRPIASSPKAKEAGREREQAQDNVEYSSREVKPSCLLLQDLLRAHSIFLLHHDSSLSALFVRSTRDKLTRMLTRYWDLFLSTWNVLLHGNPLRNVFGGIKMAACGELGVGVGEEERGSGEREMLEGLVDRVDGLVDVVVGKFGTDEPEVIDESTRDAPHSTDALPWLGSGSELGAEDGAIFLGTGALSRHSLRNITYWMEDIYSWGDGAYGVGDSPTATRTRLRRARAASSLDVPPRTLPDAASPPPPITSAHRGGGRYTGQSSTPADTSNTPPTSAEDTGHAGVKNLMSYLKLGYGTAWSLGSVGETHTNGTAHAEDSTPSRRALKAASSGRYLIGLMGDIDEEAERDSSVAKTTTSDEAEKNSRTLIRTLTVELEMGRDGIPESEVTKDFGSQDRELKEQRVYSNIRHAQSASTSFDSQDRNKTKKLRVIVYVNKPFIFVFLFQLRTDSLALEGLYRSLHHQLAPLRQTLLVSTAYRPENPNSGSAAVPIFDLVWDSRTMTVHSTIPNIPGLGLLDGANEKEPWTRVEALNTHTQLLNTYSALRADPFEHERTCKTSRGWWIVWSRILTYEPLRPSVTSQGFNSNASDQDSDVSQTGRDDITPTQDMMVSKEIVLVCKAGERAGSVLRGQGGSYGTDGGDGWADGVGRLAHGIGIDTRKYIEGLLTMTR